MIKLRERSHILLWTLLFFFVASMAVGGLVGGANIINLIFGSRNTQLNAGRVGNKNITHNRFLREREIQLNRMRRQGQEIDNRAYQNASDFAWNAIIERELKDHKIKELGLEVSLDEIYDFLLNTPPQAFQTDLISTGFFSDEDGKFDSELYEERVRNGTMPVDVNPLLINWENYLRTWLADRKLQTLYNQLGSVSDEDVRRKYSKDSLSCTIDYIYITVSSVPDSIIDVSDTNIAARYEKDKEDAYATNNTRKVVYTIFTPKPATNIKVGNVYIYHDNTDPSSKQDQALQDAILFAEEADYSSFKEALAMYSIKTTDTINVHETFEGNSGIPFQMGVLRPAVRFAFDNSIGSISDPITAQNGIAVFHSLSETSGGYKPLDDVRASILRTLTRENKKDYAKSLLKGALNNSYNWETLANSESFLQYSYGETQKIGGSFPGISKSNELTGTLLAMEVGEISSVLETFNAVVVLQLASKDELDEAKYQEDYTKIRDNMLNIERSRGYTSWLTDARKSIKTEDYRSEIY